MTPMQVSAYLRHCRNTLNLSQEGLAHDLFRFDPDHFAHIDTAVISKWERNVVSPPIPRMQRLLHYFQTRTQQPFPCIDECDEERNFLRFYNREVSKLLGRPKTLVGHAPLALDFEGGFSLRSLRGHPRSDDLLELTAMMLDATNPSFSAITTENLRQWMTHPTHLFQVVMYKQSFLGLLFTLKLTPEAFESVLSFRKRKQEIRPDDFVPENKKGSILALAFFSMSPSIATLLIARLHAHFVAHQRHIEAFGFLTANPDAQSIAEKMELTAVASKRFDGTTLIAYRNDLFPILRSEVVIKSFFDKAAPL